MLKRFVQRQHNSAMEAKTIQKSAFGTKQQKKRYHFFILCAVITIIFASCSTAKIYTKPSATSYTMKHRTLAILPPKVHLEPNKNETVESKQAREKDLTVNAQNTMFQNFYKFGRKYNIYLDVQDVEKTNKKLVEIGCPGGDCEMTIEELAKALGVDAVLLANGNLQRVYARNVAGGIAYAIIFFPYGTPLGIILACQKTGIGNVDLKLYDGESGYLLWTYSDKYSFQEGQQDEIFMMKRMVKKSPYNVK